MTTSTHSAPFTPRPKPQLVLDKSLHRPTVSPPQQEFTFDEEVMKVAKQITLADLLDSTALRELTIAHLLMLISNARSNLFKSSDKTDREKILQVDLQDLYRVIGQESMDAAHQFITNGTRQ